MTLAEVLVSPMRNSDVQRIAQFEMLLSLTQPQVIRKVPGDRAILRRSAELRAMLGGPLIDAIDVAAAAYSGCSVFVTEDNRLRVPPGLPKLNLAELAKLLPPPAP